MQLLNQVPNLLGLIRILLTPLMAYWILQTDAWSLIWAAILLFLMAMSDIVDGRMARALKVVSPLGIYLDTISDKIFIAGALLPLVEIGLLPSWFALTIIVREFAVSGLRSYAAAQGEIIPARAWGKQKLTFTVMALIWLMVYYALPSIPETPFWFVWLSQWWQIPAGFALIWTIASGAEYFWNARELLAKAVFNSNIPE
jgi:CDP-diacylglycerol--glycerol-3-phosphate 3-phosphatidyltransferase